MNTGNNNNNTDAKLRRLLLQVAADAYTNYHTNQSQRQQEQRSNYNQRRTATRRHTNDVSTNNNQEDGIVVFFLKILGRLKQILYLSVMAEILFLLALMFYVILYLLIVPSSYTKLPIYFDYTSMDISQDRSTFVYPPPIYNDPPTCHASSSCFDDNDSTFSSITGTVDLFSQHTQWYPNPEIMDEISITPPPISLNDKNHKENDVNTGVVKRNVLIPNQKYFLNLELVLPESEINSNLGMFMVNVQLYSSSDTPSIPTHEDDPNNGPTKATTTNPILLAYSKRPAMLPYESPIVEFVRKSVFMGPLLLGVFPEVKTVEIPSFDQFIENESKPLSLVRVQIIVPKLPTQHYHSQHKGSSSSSSIVYNPALQILSAEVHIGKELNPIQFLMKEWFYSCAIMIIFVFMLWEILLWHLFQFGWKYMIANKSKRTRKEKMKSEWRQRQRLRERQGYQQQHHHQQQAHSDDVSFLDDEASEIYMNMNDNLDDDDDNSENWEDMSDFVKEEHKNDDESVIGSEIFLDDNYDCINSNTYHSTSLGDCDDDDKERERVTQSNDDNGDDRDSNKPGKARRRKKKVIPMKRKLSLKVEEKMRAEKFMRGRHVKIPNLKLSLSKKGNIDTGKSNSTESIETKEGLS